MNIIDVLNSKEEVFCGKGVSVKEVLDAEKKLSVNFSSEYREYLEKMAIVAYEGHELTGLSKTNRTNVIIVTQRLRTECLHEEGWYVIEDTNIDQIVIWQDEDGKIYRTIGKAQPVLIADSLAQYVISC